MGTNIAVLLGCSKSSRQCDLYYLQYLLGLSTRPKKERTNILDAATLLMALPVEVQGDVGRYGEMWAVTLPPQTSDGALLNVIRVRAHPNPNPSPSPSPNPNQARYSTSPRLSSPCCPPPCIAPRGHAQGGAGLPPHPAAASASTVGAGAASNHRHEAIGRGAHALAHLPLRAPRLRTLLQGECPLPPPPLYARLQ